MGSIMKGLIYGALGNCSKEQDCHWDPGDLVSFGSLCLMVSCHWKSHILLSRLGNVIGVYVLCS